MWPQSISSVNPHGLPPALIKTITHTFIKIQLCTSSQTHTSPQGSQVCWSMCCRWATRDPSALKLDNQFLPPRQNEWPIYLSISTNPSRPAHYQNCKATLDILELNTRLEIELRIHTHTHMFSGSTSQIYTCFLGKIWLEIHFGLLILEMVDQSTQT